ncbi:MAG: SPOR domain-containing protein [Gammaproteobacteria bacterium]|jgi:TPR repeat protein
MMIIAASKRTRHSPVRTPARLTLTMLVALLCSPTIAAPAQTTGVDLDSALGALERLAYDDAAGILKHLAQSGDAKAQAALATLIESGLTADDYPATPLELLHKAATQNVPEAALELGNRYYLGEGVPRDAAQSIAWWRRAATHGSARAAYNLGVATLDGNGAEPRSARTWLQQAADGDIAAAWFALGVLDLREPPDSPAYREACASFEHAANGGNARAQANLGAMYERGIACPGDHAAALGWYRRAAANGIPGAVENLARLEPSIAAPPIHDDTWVVRQDAAHYTVQIANGTNEDAIIEILKHHEQSVERARFRLSASEPPRYVAIVGVFTSYLEALNYLNALPATLTGTKPWIRRFGSLQALIGN